MLRYKIYLLNLQWQLQKIVCSQSWLLSNITISSPRVPFFSFRLSLYKTLGSYLRLFRDVLSDFYNFLVYPPQWIELKPLEAIKLLCVEFIKFIWVFS